MFRLRYFFLTAKSDSDNERHPEQQISFKIPNIFVNTLDISKPDHKRKLCPKHAFVLNLKGWRNPDQDCKVSSAGCQSTPCQNDGSCREVAGTSMYVCDCAAAYSGKLLGLIVTLLAGWYG